MPDFEMPYFVDGGGNKGYFKDSTARNKIGDLSQTGVSGDDAADQIGSLNNFKCEGGNVTAIKTSITSQMDALKAAGKSGVFPFYISSGNDDFPTTGYCMAIGAIRNGGVSTITAVNSQTGDIWTNGNTSQNAGDWIGWKNTSAITVVEKGSLGLSATKTIDVGSTNGIYLLLLGHGGGGDMLGLYCIKITHYQAGTVVKTILNPATAAPTITATGISSTGSITITTTSSLGCSYSLYKFNIYIP